MKAKVLHISKYYSPHIGGIEDICKSIVDNMKDEIDSSVLCFSDNEHDSIEYIDGIKVVRAGIWKQIARQSIPYHFGKLLKKEIKDFAPNIIHLHVPNPLAMLYVLLYMPKNTKLILHWHSDIIVHNRIHAIISPIEKAIIKRADTIIATSPQYLNGSKWIKPYKNKCIIIPNIVSEEKLKSIPKSGIKISDVKHKYGNEIVLFIGRHIKYKGINYLIDSAKYLKSGIKVLIAGSGPDTNKLKKYALDSPNIKFIGRIEDDELATYLKAAQVFAFPSISKNEAFGIALAEAMYCGAVPVTFHVPDSGVNWVSIKEETGKEVENRNSIAFADAINSLFNDRELRNELSINAINRAKQKFTIRSIYNSLLEIYTLKE